MILKYLRKTLEALYVAISNPRLLNLILDSDQRWQKYVSRKHPDMMQLPQVDLHSLLGDKDHIVSPFSMLDGGSLPTDLLLLKLLAQRIPDCQYFEIGTWRGESAANVAKVAKQCYSLDLTDDQLRAKGYDNDYISVIGMYLENLKNVIQLRGDSKSYPFSELNQKFDLIFIDGNHRYESVKTDTINVFRHFAHEESIVVWHDYGFSPERIRHEVLAGILDGLPPGHHEYLYHYSNTLCAVYTTELLSTEPVKHPTKPKRHFSITLQSKER